MSALFIRRCWCFGPRPAGQSIFATTAFSQLMMLLSERGFAEEVDVLAKPVFLFIYFLFQSRSFFFSCSVRNMYYNRKNTLFYKKKNHINSLQHEEKERKKGTQVMTGIYSHLLFMSSARASDLSPFIKFLHCHSQIYNISRGQSQNCRGHFLCTVMKLVLAGHSLKTSSIKVLRVHKMTMWNVGRPFDIFRH